jgi:hypothetical protein
MNKLNEELQPVAVLPSQVLNGASTTYNGNALGGTGPFSAATTLGYLDAAGFNKAQVLWNIGGITGPGTATLTAVVGPAASFATGMAGVTGLNSFTMTATTADDNTLKIGEIDLSKVPGAQLWIKLEHPSNLFSTQGIVVNLGGPDKSPVANTVTAEFNG